MKNNAEYTNQFLRENPRGNWRTIFNFGSLSLSIIFLSTRLSNVTFWEWMLLPVMMVVGNLAVYLIHRYPLHRYWKFYTFPYNEHTVKHHSAYQYHDLEIHSFKEICNIVFPPPVVLGFVVGYIPVVYFVSSLILSHNAAVMIVLGSAIYFMLYETMHTISHVPEDHFLMKSSYLRFMRNHHRLHHHQRLMSKWNFNIVYPLFDWLTGCMVKELPEGIPADNSKKKEIA